MSLQPAAKTDADIPADAMENARKLRRTFPYRMTYVAFDPKLNDWVWDSVFTKHKPAAIVRRGGTVFYLWSE